MKILALSDQVKAEIYRPSIVERFGEVHLIVGCGDLPAYYLEYIVTQLNVPLVYVPGNHDPDDLHVPGGESVEGKVIRWNEIVIAGLGGSRRYKSEGKHQYTEAEMRWRSLKLFPRLMYMRVRHRRFLDVLITHAPPLGIHDASDLAHTGFATFRDLVELYRPKLMLHGHSHAIRNLDSTLTRYRNCDIVNVFPYRVIEVPEA
jgi:Icc-related predicted phosphoesterase